MANWLLDWQYRKKHVINQTVGASSGYQVKINVAIGSGTDSGDTVYIQSGKCKSDFSDIRFTKGDEASILSYWLESKTDGTSASFWVKIDDDLSAGNVTIYVYYGNPNAESASDLYNTMDGVVPNVVAFYDMNEGSGITINDKSGNGNNGTIYGASWVDGKYGKALSFNGVDNYVAVPDSPSLDVINEITIVAWLNLIQTGGSETFLSKQYNTVPYWGAWITNSRYATYQIGKSGSSAYLSSTNPITWEQWHQIAVTQKGYDACIYADGNLSNSNHLDISISETNNNNALLIGKASTGEYVKGIIDNICIFNRALSATEISLLYSSTKIPFTVPDNEESVGRVLVRKYVSPEPTHGTWDSEISFVPSMLPSSGVCRRCASVVISDMYCIFDANDFLASDFFTARALDGTVSNDGETYTSSIKLNATLNATSEYYDFELYFTPNGGRTAIEFNVPDCYMGMDIWQDTTSKTGDASYSLSVPYDWNLTDIPPKDWGTLTLSNGSNADGTIKRIQLVSNVAEETKLKFRVYYATSPAVGFDGVDDYVDFGNDASLQLNETWTITSYVKPINTMGVIVLKGNYAWSTPVKSYGQVFYDFDELRIGTAYGLLNEHLNVKAASSLSLLAWHSFESNFNSTYVAITYDGTTVSDTPGVPFVNATDLNLIVGAVSAVPYWDTYRFSGLIKNISIYNTDSGYTGQVLLMNASSFSGSSNTTVTDLSGAGNHGTAYGGVQYKVYKGNGFRTTIINRSL